MEIFITDIPEEGLHLEGELPAAIFDLPPGDPIRPLGPVRYSADIYAFDEVIVMSGWLKSQFQLQCGTCLEFFDYDAEFPDWSSEVDLEPRQRSFDLRDVIREEFLLGLPPYPRCDDFDDERECPRGHLILEAEVPGPAENTPWEESKEERNVWGALDDWSTRER